MINIARQIEYWQSSAASSIETAEILVASKKFIEGMFFCHLSIEKILKALVVKQTGNIPPKTHDLFHLAGTSKIIITEDQADFYAHFNEISTRRALSGILSESAIAGKNK